MKNATCDRIKVPARQKIILIFSGIIIALVSLEIVLRAAGGLIVFLQHYKNHPALKHTGVYKIMCIGESTTACGGPHSYPAQLYQILNRSGMNVKFVVYNEGVIATETDQIAETLEQKINTYRPHAVITMMGINDEGDHMPPKIESKSAVISWIRSFRCYKLLRLMSLHLKAKKSGKGMYMTPQDTSDAIAEETYKQAIRQNPLNAAAYAKLADIYLDRGDLALAERVLQKGIGIAPQDPDILEQWGILFREKGEYARAEGIFKKLIEVRPDKARGYELLGTLYCWDIPGRSVEGERCLRRAIEAEPENYETYVIFATIIRSHGRFGEVEELLRTAQKIVPDNEDICYELGDVCRLLGKFDEAESWFKKCITLQPGRYKPYALLAEFSRQTGKYNLAIEYQKGADRLTADYPARTIQNYLKVKEILDGKNIRFVCAQYPMRSIQPLKGIFRGTKGIVFVDNEKIFKNAVKESGYAAYFTDMFGGDFGHCTQKGNHLLAANIAGVIAREVFHRDTVLMR